LAIRQQREPPLALRLPFSFVTPDEVTLADHAAPWSRSTAALAAFLRRQFIPCPG
jgi:hypothetical protein